MELIVVTSSVACVGPSVFKSSIFDTSHATVTSSRSFIAFSVHSIIFSNIMS